jgi:hypothetical protein
VKPSGVFVFTTIELLFNMKCVCRLAASTSVPYAASSFFKDCDILPTSIAMRTCAATYARPVARRSHINTACGATQRSAAARQVRRSTWHQWHRRMPCQRWDFQVVWKRHRIPLEISIS